MSDFDLELKKCFTDEAKELLSDNEGLFLELEHSANRSEVIQRIFRVVHTVKGSSAAAGFQGLSKFSHKLESLLTAIRETTVPLTPSVMELLLQCNDRLMQYVTALQCDFSTVIDCGELLEKIDARLHGQCDDQSQTVRDGKATTFGFFDEEPPKNVESVLQPKVAPVPRAAQQAQKPQASPLEESVRVNLGRIDALVRYVGELSTYNSVIAQFRKDLPSPVFQGTVDQLTKIGKNIQDLALGLRMVPLKPTFQKMKRIVRDSAKALGKEVELILEGEDVEVDKTILEQLDGPLVHLVRNAVDHGIEKPDERQLGGKASTGFVTLSAYHETGHLVIEVRDDGKGIDPQRLLKKAIEKGFVAVGENLSDKDTLDLIFRSGFSTKAEVTDLSGRGVGMDVVKTNIEKLNGIVALDTKIGQGSVFKVTLPLTLSIIHGMLLRGNGQRYVVPLSQVKKMLQPRVAQISFLTGVGEVFMLDGKTTPLMRLERVLVTGKKSELKSEGVIVVLAVDEVVFGLFVDDVIGQQPIVIRKLGDELAGAKGFGGGAILGDGQPALILDVKTLYELYRASARHMKVFSGQPLQIVASC